jgi:hypothetical protein
MFQQFFTAPEKAARRRRATQQAKNRMHEWSTRDGRRQRLDLAVSSQTIFARRARRRP